jgi:two-component system OmpR family sensor kinase
MSLPTAAAAFAPPDRLDMAPSVQRLAHFIAPLPEMVACVLPDLSIAVANPAWCDWFDARPGQAPWPDLAEIAGAQWCMRHSFYINQVQAGTPCHFEVRKVDDLDMARWARVHLAPDLPAQDEAQPTSASSPRAFLMVMVDTTAEHTRNEIIAKQRDHIYQQVQDRSQNQKVHQELEKTRTLLDWRTTMLAERNEMLQLLSHEIRQPLNNASAAMQATMKTIADLPTLQAGPASATLMRAEHVLQQVIGTLDNTLAAATVLTDSGNVSTPTETDLPTFITLVLHDIAVDARARIHTVWETRTRTVQLHPTLMRLALRNLLNNALAYSPPEALVTLRIGETEEPLAIVIEVSDNGPGIAEEFRPLLFKKGSRGGNSRTRSGAGLGLFIVHSVLKLHHGTVEALPRLPHGTTMRMVLPQGLDEQ